MRDIKYSSLENFKKFEDVFKFDKCVVYECLYSFEKLLVGKCLYNVGNKYDILFYFGEWLDYVEL